MKWGKEDSGLLKPGDIFEKYTVEKLLGRGGMGAVYLVRHNILDSLFALKVLFPEVASKNKRFVDRFIREAKLACRIKHPNLIAVHDAGRNPENGMYYLVMDYVSGGSVRDLLKKEGQIPIREAVSIVEQVAMALKAAGEYGMVHRDIKPDNIMFAADGSVKLADLGIAKSANEQDTMLTLEASVFGTPAYMSPEQAMDSRKVDSRADIYSLGIVLFEMISGQRPFYGKGTIEILSQVVNEEPVPDIRTICSSVPESVAALICAMTQKKLQQRLQSPSDLLRCISKLSFPDDSVDEKRVVSSVQVEVTAPTLANQLDVFLGNKSYETMPTKETALLKEQTPVEPQMTLPTEEIKNTVYSTSCTDQFFPSNENKNLTENIGNGERTLKTAVDVGVASLEKTQMTLCSEEMKSATSERVVLENLQNAVQKTETFAEAEPQRTLSAGNVKSTALENPLFEKTWQIIEQASDVPPMTLSTEVLGPLRNTQELDHSENIQKNAEGPQSMAFTEEDGGILENVQTADRTLEPCVADKPLKTLMTEVPNEAHFAEEEAQKTLPPEVFAVSEKKLLHENVTVTEELEKNQNISGNIENAQKEKSSPLFLNEKEKSGKALDNNKCQELSSVELTNNEEHGNNRKKHAFFLMRICGGVLIFAGCILLALLLFKKTPAVEGKIEVPQNIQEKQSVPQLEIPSKIKKNVDKKIYNDISEYSAKSSIESDKLIKNAVVILSGMTEYSQNIKTQLEDITRLPIILLEADSLYQRQLQEIIRSKPCFVLLFPSARWYELGKSTATFETMLNEETNLLKDNRIRFIFVLDPESNNLQISRLNQTVREFCVRRSFEFVEPGFLNWKSLMR